MEKVRNSGMLKLAFDIIMGVVLLTLVAVFFGGSFDLPVIVLISILVIAGTVLLVRQDSQIIHATSEKHA